MKVQDCCFNISDAMPKACWVVTDSCNLSCDYCAADSCAAKYYEDSLATEPFLEEVVERCKKAGIRKVILSGGEPFILPNIPDVVEHLTRNGISVSICTNGTLLSEPLLDSLMNAGLSNLVIGIDFSRIGSRSSATHSFYTAKISNALHIVERRKIPYKMSLVFLPAIEHKITILAEWIRNYEPYSVNLIEPQNCGRLTLTSCINNKWGKNYMQETMERFAFLVAPIRTIFVSPRCQQPDCPSQNLIFGISSHGLLSECPWKHHFAASVIEDLVGDTLNSEKI